MQTWVYRQPFVILATAFAGGILLQHTLNLPLWLVSMLFVLLLTILILAIACHWFAEGVAAALIALLIVLMGGLRIQSWKQVHFKHPLLKALPIHSLAIAGEIEEVRRMSPASAVLGAHSVTLSHQTWPFRGKILLYFPAEQTVPIRPGMQVTLQEVDLENLPVARNPGEFDYGNYLKWRGISAVVKIASRQHYQLIPARELSVGNQIFPPIRAQILQRIERHFDAFCGGFLKAILLGDRQDLSPDLIREFQNTGIVHVLAISGLHVGFVALIFYLLISFLPLPFKIQNVLVLVSLLFYAGLIGNQPSVWRATLMIALYLLAVNLERKPSIYNIIFAAAFFILLFQPQQLFWVGFQFSFAAVLSIVFFLERFKSFPDTLLQKVRPPALQTKIKQWIVLPFLVSFAAQIGTLPLSAFYFYKISLVSFVLNIFVIPLIGGIVAAGMLFLLLAFVAPILAAPLAELLSFVILLLKETISAISQVPFAYLVTGKVTLLRIGIYAAILWLLMGGFKLSRRRYLAGVGAALLMLAILLGKGSRPLQIVFLDVGQGDAAIIKTADFKNLMVDTGSARGRPDQSYSSLSATLNFLGISRLHKLIISHPHMDHMGEVFKLIESIAIDSVYLPVAKTPYFWRDSLLKMLRVKAIGFRELQWGQILPIDAHTRLYVLGPFPVFETFEQPSGKNVNNNSLVFLLKHERWKILFPGDVERSAENYLCLWEELLKSDVLKVSHHGSLTSTTEAFLERVKPGIAVISVGRKNKFRHPSSEVVQRLHRVCERVYRTDRDHAVWLRFWKNSREEVNWRN